MMTDEEYTKIYNEWLKISDEIDDSHYLGKPARYDISSEELGKIITQKGIEMGLKIDENGDILNPADIYGNKNRRAEKKSLNVPDWIKF